MCTEGAQRELQFVQPGCTSDIHRERYPNAGAPKAAGRAPATLVRRAEKGQRNRRGHISTDSLDTEPQKHPITQPSKRISVFCCCIKGRKSDAPVGSFPMATQSSSPNQGGFAEWRESAPSSENGADGATLSTERSETSEPDPASDRSTRQQILETDFAELKDGMSCPPFLIQS